MEAPQPASERIGDTPNQLKDNSKNVLEPVLMGSVLAGTAPEWTSFSYVFSEHRLYANDDFEKSTVRMRRDSGAIRFQIE